MSGPIVRPVGHEGYHTNSTKAGVVAECECGWRSQLLSGGGLAGGAWDRHVEEMYLEEAFDE